MDTKVPKREQDKSSKGFVGHSVARKMTAHVESRSSQAPFGALVNLLERVFVVSGRD